jgi:hypothetical protein
LRQRASNALVVIAFSRTCSAAAPGGSAAKDSVRRRSRLAASPAPSLMSSIWKCGAEVSSWLELPYEMSPVMGLEALA